jgi:N-formylglutamate amidohydrolase
MQQLLAVPRAECLHDSRRRYKPAGLVQILGQKAELRATGDMFVDAILLKRRGTPVVTAPPARLDLNRNR